MKKLIQTLSVAILSAGVMTGVAAAQSISNTGPGSTNTVTNTTTNTPIVTCVNSTTVTNSNSQSSNSGTSTNSGNTNSGGATTGSSSNNNTTVTNVTTGCPAGQVRQVVGGHGSGPGGSFTAAEVAALPLTGSHSALNNVAVGIAVLGGAAIASQVAVSAYRRNAFKQL